MTTTAKPVARIQNIFFRNACYQLTAREQKLILFLISKIDARQDRFHAQLISVVEIENIFYPHTKRYGSIYQDLRTFRENIMKKGIKFKSDILLDGKPFPDYVNWFQSVKTVKNSSENLSLEFLFSEPLKPFLLDLTKQYARISIQEILKMKSRSSIRLFLILKAHRAKLKKHQKKSILVLSIDEIKTLLHLQGKYKHFKDFKKRILSPIEKEINLYASIHIELVPVHTGKKITSIRFIITDQFAKSTEANAPSFELPMLSRSQLFALKVLEKYGINSDIIRKQFFPLVQGSEIIGFEDWYFEEAIKIFENKSFAATPKAKAGTFVKWFLNSSSAFRTDQFPALMEILSARKKKLQQENQKAWDNRILAKTMTNSEFEKRIYS